MLKHRTTLCIVFAGSIALAPLTGCSNLPGGPKTQGTVIGAGGGALAGALIDRNHRGTGAVIGAALGAGGGWLIGAQKSKIDKQNRDEAAAAHENAKRNPATVDDVRRTNTADLNGDGFVTMDEVVAMQKAGLSDSEMIDRLRRTDQVFELTEQQENYLRDRNVSQRVVDAMLDMNRGYGTDRGPAAPARAASDRGPAGVGSPY